MNNTKKTLIALLSSLVAAGGIAASTSSCAVTQHPTAKSTLGVARSTEELVAVLDVPGEVTVETVASADWAVPSSGVINLENPKAKDVKDEPFAIVVPFHALRHPTRGLFVIDTGVEQKMKTDPEHAAVRGVVASFLGDSFVVKHDLKTFLDAQPQPLQGVFFTHLHLDHILGVADVPANAALYAGPGETTETSFQNLIVSPNTDRALAGHAALNEWQFVKGASNASNDAEFDGVVDVFGDGQVWALWLPGHTPGTTAYLVRTPNGPVLFTGDVSHTRWGWEHDVEPGTYSENPAASAASFHKLRAFAEAHHITDIRFGHAL